MMENITTIMIINNGSTDADLKIDNDATFRQGFFKCSSPLGPLTLLIAYLILHGSVKQLIHISTGIVPFSKI